MWLIIGMIMGIAYLSLELWYRAQNVKVTWYDRLIGAIGGLLLLFTIQNILGSRAELESTAAYMFMLVTGLPAVILMAVAWQLIIRRQ